MNIAYIFPHLGLGDQIISNGLVRHYSELYDKIYLFCKPQYLSNVSYMYRDNINIHFLSLNDNEVIEFMKINPNNNYIVTGHTNEYFKLIDSSVETFDTLFYKILNIDPNIKWDKFYYERNKEKELSAFYETYNLKNEEEYIFIHESVGRKVYRNIDKSIKQIHPDNMNLNIFDYLYIIEKAKEVHVMNSSFMNLIDCMQLKHNNLFYHEYARPGINTTLKLNWTIYK